MSVGDNGSLLCKSIIPISAIEWLNSNGEVIISATNTSELSLIFVPVNVSINNQVYTCRVNKNASVNKTSIVSVRGKIIMVIMRYYPYLISCNKQWKTLS